MIKFLLLFDADRIKDYVFTTGRLREIRGASELVRQATSTPALLRLDLADGQALTLFDRTSGSGEVVFAAGGTGLIMVDSEARAQIIGQALQRLYQQTTNAGSMSTAWVAWDSAGDETFGTAAKRAAAKLRLRKAARRPSGVAPAGGVVAFCDSCRQEPRIGYDPRRGEDGLLCRTCLTKRQASRAVRGNLPGQPFWRNFVAGMDDTASAAWSDRAVLEAEVRDFRAIGQRARPVGYVGFCYADGDGIGGLLDDATTPEVYQALSEAIDGTVSAALGQALQLAYAATAAGWRTPAAYRADNRAGHPFEVIAAGGDDVLVVATAERALYVALYYCRTFAAELSRRLQAAELRDWWQRYGAGRQPSSSAGVLIAHDTMPAITLTDRARELLRSAKRGREWLGKEEGAVDFHLVTTPSLSSIAQVRRSQYRVAGNISLTARPYSLAGLADLLAYARAVRHSIRSHKQADLYAALFQEPFLAVLDLLRVQSRLNSAGRKVLLAAAERFNWRDHYPYGQTPPLSDLWRFTGMIDLLEVAGLGAPPAEEA